MQDIDAEPVPWEMAEIIQDLKREEGIPGSAFIRNERSLQHSNGAILQADHDIVTPLCVFSRQGRYQGVLVGAIREQTYEYAAWGISREYICHLVHSALFFLLATLITPST
jgi:hypothetical protein